MMGFDIEEISPSDRPLVKPGAVFYWAMTYRDEKDGTRRKAETIRFARQPILTERDIRDLLNEADSIAALLEGV